MIRHTICFKLKDSSEASKNEAKEMLLSMKGKVPQICDIDVYCDFLCSPRSYDVILNVYLADEKALDDYQIDEYHHGVVKAYFAEKAAATIAVDVYV